ncbi:long-chain fatty acid--CoA ligase [Dechloromonas sp.]|uniref:AMP-dependent synthetase/ligase n=1 Tax=Dechloromonas sp. TaxID=1917218 RepID=UPI00120A6CE9|nr:AMP-binding protein [Dechloromonas sp.]MBU3698146.1 long-chain fatty acid--CoA ligase [Dechloromonas sp.]TEX49283.1 MAG: long-chain fatty acid--CoA ligase [Rhodocyclaceae bacterium]
MPTQVNFDSLDGLHTFPRLLFQHAKVRPTAPAMREKHLGIWQTWTWSDVAERVRALACGLASLGFKRGDNLAIIGDNRPHLYMMMSAAQCLGGVPVPLYQDAVAAEMLFVLQDAGVRFAIVEDQEQVDKLLEIKDQLPALEHIVYDDPRGMRHYNQPFLHDVHELMEMGRIHDRNHSDFLNAEVEKGHFDDVSVMLYTSGTTGKPKGVCQTHAAFIAAAQGGAQVDKLGSEGDILSYLPMAWVGDHLFSFAQSLVCGFTINCPESGETVMTDLREIGPTYYFAPPRVFESLLTSVQIRMEDAGKFKQRMFNHFMDVAKRCGGDILDGKSVSGGDRFQYWLGNLLIYGPLRNVLGMSRIKVAYTAGAAIGPELFSFYRSIGINLKQLYGQTETCAYVCLQPDGQVKSDTVGAPAPGVEIKIADNGEVLVKGAMLLKEYYKRPDATAESINAEGYFLTGDAGFLDEDGHLKIIDRAKDVGKLSNGAMFAPNYIENKLKFYPFVKEAVCFGHDRDMVCAFINIDVGAVGNWAERRNIAYAGYTDLAGKAQVLEMIKTCIEEVNAGLAHDAMVADSQVHRFLVLHKELDPDDDELTRTRKVRRNFIAEKYKVLIDALYAGKSNQFIETEVKFEDGRRGKVSADLKILDVKTFPIAKKAA